MIIEAGYDILELLMPTLDSDSDDANRHGLWVMCLDAELHYLSIRRACDIMTESLETHAADILKVLESDFRPVAYFVLGHAVPFVLASDDSRLHETDERIRSLPLLAGYRMLGRIVADPEGYVSSVPRYSFRDYSSLDDLPRAAVIPGPHQFDCQCLSCTQHEQLLTRIRKRSQSRNAAAQNITSVE